MFNKKFFFSNKYSSIKKDMVISQNATFGTVFGFAKKGVTPVIATSILLVIGIISVVGFQGWYETFSSNLLLDAEKSSDKFDTVSIEELIGDTLYLKAGNNLSVKSIKIDGNDCRINGTYSGTQGLDVSECLRNVSSPTPEIVMVTNNKIETKRLYLKEISNEVYDNLNFQSSDNFISIWNTSEFGTSNSNQIALPLTSSGFYNFNVTGDNLIGSPITVTSFNDNILNFTTNGIQEIEINGIIDGWSFNNIGDKEKIYDISQWGSLKLGNDGGYFYGATNLNISATDILNTTGMTTFSNAFRSTNLYSIPNINQWDTSEVTSLSGTFRQAVNFNQDLNSWDTSSLNNLFETFYEATNFNGDISSWNTSSVTTMKGLFDSAIYFNQDISVWDVSNVENMRETFWSAQAFNQDLNSWNTSNVNNMLAMFMRASAFNQDLDSWDTSNVVYFHYMFKEANLFNGNISSWNTSSGINMLEMFMRASNFNQPLGSWDVSNVNNMNSMFRETNSFNQDLNSWNTSSVTTMANMFRSSNFNQPLDNWDVSSVTDLSFALRDTPFNQPLNSWNISNAQTLEGLFKYTRRFNQDLNSWDTSNVENMEEVFRYATDFNGNISSWNTSNVLYMNRMFLYQSSFSYNISTWDVSNVIQCTDFSHTVNLSPNFTQCSP